MRTPIVVLVAFLLLSQSVCQARLGDTMEQCVARYGQPVPAKDNSIPGGFRLAWITFQKNGYFIKSIFVNGIVGAECVFKSDSSALSEQEKNKILHADSKGWAWGKATGRENWVRTDGAIASYDSSKHFMALESTSFIAALATEEKNK